MADPHHPKQSPRRDPTLAVWRPASAPAASIERPKTPDEVATVQSAPPPRPPTAAGSEEGAVLAVGSIIGERYVIEQHISSGGFGAVYRASDREIRHHQVALKLLHRPAASEVERESALRELKLIATVSHPSVVQFKEYGWHEGRLWFAMPWYRGQTLDRVMGSGEAAVAMSRAEARPLFARIAQGLAAMHAVGIHHHDIKPENIFVAEVAGFPGGLPVLLDLGIATQRGENPKGLTVEYASPETAAAMLGSGTRPIGGAADVYSLALVLRNALDPSVATPVTTSEVLPLLHQRATQPVELSTRRDLKYMRPSFERWLSLEPDDRPSAAELADELAILTEPEERHQARMRLLQRIVPIVLLAAVMVTGLVFQLRRTKTALTVQGRVLEEQLQVGDELRKQSQTQLEQLEQSAQKLGDERKQLQQALGLARQLNTQLADTARRAATQERRATKVTQERDGLARDKQALSAERERLTQTNQTLTAERATLTAQRDRLSADNAALARARDEAASERARLMAERDQAQVLGAALNKQLALLSKDRDRLSKELAAKDARYETVARQRDEALAKQGELTGKLAKVRADRAELEQRVSELEAKAASAAPVRSAPKPAKKPRARFTPTL